MKPRWICSKIFLSIIISITCLNCWKDIFNCDFSSNSCFIELTCMSNWPENLFLELELDLILLFLWILFLDMVLISTFRDADGELIGSNWVPSRIISEDGGNARQIDEFAFLLALSIIFSSFCYVFKLVFGGSIWFFIFYLSSCVLLPTYIILKTMHWGVIFLFANIANYLIICEKYSVISVI